MGSGGLGTLTGRKPDTGTYIPLSQLCTLNIPPYLSEIYKYACYFVQFAFFAQFTFFDSLYFDHDAFTLYTYWTLAEYLKIASSFEFGLELNTAREIGKLKMDWSQDFDERKCN